MKSDNYSEQLILQAAEEVFIEKGLHGAGIFAIAKRAKVSIPVFRTYFKTKQDVFLMLILRKIRTISVLLLLFYDKLPFEEAMKRVIGQHFDILARNPKLVSFLYNDVISNEANRKFLLEHLSTRLYDLYNSIEKMIDAEVEKGDIRPVAPMDLILNVISLNVLSLAVYPVIKDMKASKSPEYFECLLRERKESNIQFILNALRP